MSEVKVLRRIQKLYGGRRPLAPSFMPSGRKQFIIYAVALKEHPRVTKVGRTLDWERRRYAYANWNLAAGDGIAEERLFRITEEFIDLPALEAHVLASMPFARRYGQEWFVAGIDDVGREIDRVLNSAGLSYV